MKKSSQLTVKLTKIHTRKGTKSIAFATYIYLKNNINSHLEEKKELEVGGDLLKSRTE